MARIKKTSFVIEDASVRVAGLKSIDTNLDLGNGLTIGVYLAKIDEVKTSLEAYNTALSLSDEKSNEYRAKEKELKDLHERMLTGVAAKYGRNSNEYEKAGGTRKSDRKRPERRVKA